MTSQSNTGTRRARVAECVGHRNAAFHFFFSSAPALIGSLPQLIWVDGKRVGRGKCRWLGVR